MVSAVSSASAITPASSSAASPTAAADKVLNTLLNNDDVMQYLTERTQRYVPVSTSLILATLWGGINVNGSRAITEADLQKFVVASGGKASDTHALWLALNPPDANGITPKSMDAAAFAFNTYLSQTINSKLSSIEDTVAQKRLEAGPDTSTSLFGTLDTFGGTSSYIGVGIFVNVFV